MKYFYILTIIAFVAVSWVLFQRITQVEQQLLLAQSSIGELRDELVSTRAKFGATISSTATTDTLETFRTNVNSSLTSLRDDNVSTTTAYSWTALQTFLANATTSQLTSTSSAYLATSAGKVGVGSTSPLGVLGIGNTATSTISGNFFCAYFKTEGGSGLWIKLNPTQSTIFSTSTTACN